MLELKTKDETYICYFEGDIEEGHKYRGLKTTMSITGKIIREKIATRINLYVKVILLQKNQYEILISIFRNFNENLTLTDLNSGKMYTNLYIDLEEFRLEQDNLGNQEANDIFYKGEIQFAEMG